MNFVDYDYKHVCNQNVFVLNREVDLGWAKSSKIIFNKNIVIFQEK